MRVVLSFQKNQQRATRKQEIKSHFWQRLPFWPIEIRILHLLVLNSFSAKALSKTLPAFAFRNYQRRTTRKQKNKDSSLAKIGSLANMKSGDWSFFLSILFQLKLQAKHGQFLILQAEKGAQTRKFAEKICLLYRVTS